MISRAKEHTGGGCWVHWLSNDNGLCVGFTDEVGILYYANGKLLNYIDCDEDTWYNNQDEPSNYKEFWNYLDKDNFNEKLLSEAGFSIYEIDEIKLWIIKSRSKNYDWEWSEAWH